MLPSNYFPVEFLRKLTKTISYCGLVLHLFLLKINVFRDWIKKLSIDFLKLLALILLQDRLQLLSPPATDWLPQEKQLLKVLTNACWGVVMGLLEEW